VRQSCKFASSGTGRQAHSARGPRYAGIEETAPGLRQSYTGGRPGASASSAHVLAQALGLRVRPRGGRDALSEQPGDHEVERPQVREFVAPHLQLPRLRHQLPEAVHREVVRQPGVRGVAAPPDADVGVAALVAGAGAEGARFFYV